ncbi:hypothetical protein ACI1T1_08115, partial [Lactococcus formosensis subsp. formosensis]
SHLLSPEHSDDFLEEDSEGEHHEHLADLLQGIRNNAMDQDWGLPGLPTENPPADVDSSPRDFNFGLMEPGRLFIMAGQQFRYLENQGGGNHLIIRNTPIFNVSWNNQSDEKNIWYSNLIKTEPVLEEMIQPVALPAFNDVAGVVSGSGGLATWEFVGSHRWVPLDLNAFPEVANDETFRDISGSKQAFSLSLADVKRLSGPGLGFSNLAQSSSGWWWLRTPAGSSLAWVIHMDGGLNAPLDRSFIQGGGGTRPALIIYQRVR